MFEKGIFTFWKKATHAREAVSVGPTTPAQSYLNNQVKQVSLGLKVTSLVLPQP